VINIHRPDLDGFETASLIRARERSHSTPIVFPTADDSAEARLLDSYRLGAADYVHKSVDPDMICSELEGRAPPARRTPTRKWIPE
jgi:DNA-binding response OmpR family regulator